MHPPSRLTRAARGLTALLAVWCLGCSGYDELLARILPGSGVMMVCDSERSASSVVALASQEPVLSIGAPATDQVEHAGTACGCDSCYAPAPASLAPAPTLAALPHQPAADPGEPPRVDRAPLVPPPQRGA